MAVLTLEHLKTLAAAPSLKAHPVPVYELGAARVAYVAELSADERDERLEVSWLAHKADTGQENNVGFRAWAAAACWCDASRAFVAKDAKAIAAVAAQLGGLDSKPVTRMFVKASELNGLTEEDVEDLEKNLPPAGDGNGTSPLEPDSPAPVNGSNA